MLVILSPAKTMDMSPVSGIPAGTPSRFDNEAELIASKMKRYSSGQLEKLLGISTKLAETNYQRYQQFDDPATPSKQAILAYNGSVFKEMSPSTFSADDFAYAQQHLRIVSTLYGVTRPLDLIKAYRIAFPLKLDGMDGTLYDFWKDKLTRQIIIDAEQEGGIMINLASLDIADALDMDLIGQRVKIIMPEFKEYRDGKYQVIRTYAKLARGAMAREIVTRKVEKPEDLKKFTELGFCFKPELSDENHYIYTR